MSNQSRIGANILKRTIEYMSSQPFDADREAAMDILNTAIEQCFASEGATCGCNRCMDCVNAGESQLRN